MTQPRKRIAILISGRGSNMKSLVKAARAPDYPAEVVVVISNRPDAPGLDWAKAQGIPALTLDHKRYDNRAHFEGQLQTVLTSSTVDLVCLAGFMRLMTADFVNQWHNRMLNIHPALLPSFKGLHTHERAIEAGVKVAGCTVHLVRPEMDEGPILGQAAVPVLQGDTPDRLGARVLEAEHKLYPHVVRLYASGQIQMHGEIAKYSIDINPEMTLFSPHI
jgi:phosphoribosylglycinamide formyltransferase 1